MEAAKAQSWAVEPKGEKLLLFHSLCIQFKESLDVVLIQPIYDQLRIRIVVFEDNLN
jgi:hypothetical protein